MPGYKTWATNDIITAADMNELHADPLTNDVVTSESTSSTSYTDLATSGPAVTKTLANGQKVMVYVSFYGATAVDGNEQRMSFAVSGATTLAAADANAAHWFAVKTGSSTAGQADRWTLFTATASGSHTFTAKYKTASGTPTFQDRRIMIKPF